MGRPIGTKFSEGLEETGERMDLFEIRRKFKFEFKIVIINRSCPLQSSNDNLVDRLHRKFHHQRSGTDA